MSAPITSREAALELVESIAKDKGFVHPSVWATIHPETRETVQNAMRRLEVIAGVAVSTLAKNLYTSDARFVFELLQNAEDNSFVKAGDNNETPYVSFEVHPDNIIIECNEDGFEPKNLEAICSVGQSSKSGTQNGYVGEKGIGFKSVFMAASKVHITSGYFSFFFQHKRGDQGLGMITPIWEESKKDIPYPGTRMRLELGDGYNPIPSSQYQIILDQFNSLDESILLFMRNLGEIRVSVYNYERKLVQSNIFSKECIEANLVRLTKTSKMGNNVDSSFKDYYIFKHTVQNLEKNENRTYSEYEEQTKAYATAQIVLGFPLTEDRVPVVEYQDIFAFLPMKQAGFTFLINSDFVTQANRQDIVTTSARNIGIRRGIADAFVQAILEFCNDPQLQYTWMRFLPARNQHFDPFWSQLVELLDERLKETAVLRPRSENSFRLISSLRFSVDSQLDRHGEPLFRDNNPEMHISKKYAKDDIMILRNYGLTEYTASEILAAISLDLRRVDSRMKSDNMDDDWHTRSANYLHNVYTGDPSIRFKLRNLPILPLQNETWIFSQDREVYFPEAYGLEIPPGLSLNIIVSKAAQNTARRQLFCDLGVKEANITFLRKRILDRGFVDITITSSMKQLRYFFLTDQYKSNTEDKLRIMVETNKSETVSPLLGDVYMPDDNPFGPSKLLEKVKNTDGLSVDFLHNTYIERVFQEHEADLTLKWKDWLCNYVGVKRHLRMISRKKSEFSTECLYVAANLPEKFLGYLRYSWKNETKGLNPLSMGALTVQLRSMKVLCHSGKMVTLQKTFFPLTNLETEWKKYSRGSENFPFLQIDQEVTSDAFHKDWKFLPVQYSENAYFYLYILYNVMAKDKAKDIEDPLRIFELYGIIYGKYLATSDKNEREDVRRWFRDNKYIYVPKSQYRDADRVSPGDCVWEGPATLSSKAPLKILYEAMSIKDYSSIASFMTAVLNIGNCNEDTICAQLDDLRESGSDDFERIHSLYKSLSQILNKTSTNDAKNAIKRKFAENALIYTKSDKCWSKVSQCLWSSATTIRSKKVLEADYNGMKSFFVGFLGVETLNLGLIYTELAKLGESTPTIELVKEQLLAFKDHFHLITDYKDIKPEGMRKFKIFPVRQPGTQETIQFCDGNAEFAIADRVTLEENFRQKIKMLSFTLEEVHSLEPIIKWLGLEKRYLSRLVTEASKVEDDDRVLNHSLSQSIELRARDLCRIAKTFHSPRWRNTEEFYELYKLLKQTKVFETDKISCVQIVQQGGQSYSHEISRSDFHLEESDSGLDIFVPQEQESQAFCLALALPARLFEWLTTSPYSTNSSSPNDRSYFLVKEVLFGNPIIYNKMFDAEGVLDIDIEDESDSDEESPASANSTRGEASELRDSTEVESDMATPLTDISSPRMEFDQDEILPTVAHQDIITTSSHFAPSQSYNRPSVQETSSGVSVERIEGSVSLHREAILANLGYPRFLSRVVSAARTASFPTKNTFDLAALRESLPSFATPNFNIDNYEFNSSRNISQLERDKMIGAAGELFVFELLKKCNPSLPNFGIDNWKSTIRSYARDHPEYATMQPWHGRETSDLVYHDSLGTFTKLLIDKCYFDASIWENRRPKYHFEVKTTTSSCETRFFVSKAQYKMLHDNRGKEDSVYIIMRVFNVGRSEVGLRVYVDPAELEAREELLFTTETWSVVPGA